MQMETIAMAVTTDKTLSRQENTKEQSHIKVPLQ